MKCGIMACAMVVLMSWIISAGGEIIAGWDASGIDLDNNYVAPYTVAAHTTAAHVAAAMSLTDSLLPSTTTNRYGFKIPAADAQATLAGAIAQQHYIQIVITVPEPYGLNLVSLELHGQTSSTGCDDIAVLSDVDGFSDAAVIASVSAVADVTGGFDTDDTGFGAPIDLPRPEFSELSSVTFRIYGWNSSSSSGDGRNYIRDLSGYDVVVNGTVEEIPRRGSLMVIK